MSSPADRQSAKLLQELRHELRNKDCSRQDSALDPQQAEALLTALEGWRIQDDSLCKDFSFKNYYRTMAFVNLVAWLAHQQDHHPEMQVGYNRCTVRYRTHSVADGAGGLSENDFICAAKLDALTAGRQA